MKRLSGAIAAFLQECKNNEKPKKEVNERNKHPVKRLDLASMIVGTRQIGLGRLNYV